MMRIKLAVTIVAAILAVSLTACDRDSNPIGGPSRTQELSAPSDKLASPAPPSGLVSVPVWNGTLRFWPFTGTSFSGQPQDPINLLFVGECEPGEIRAALMSLDGDRTAYGFPDAFPFNGTWHDAIGDMQTAYGEPTGWAGSAVQLECGSYGPLRFHLRLFQVGEWTLANAHLDLLIPSTTEHQVIQWELAEQMLIVDFIRGGLLDPVNPMMPTPPVNPAPFGSIPPYIYNGLPPELKALIGGPPGNVTDPIPIMSDGSAMVLNVARQAAAAPGVSTQNFVIDFDQVIPKPFCASGPYDYLYVHGPVRLRQLNVATPSGRLMTQFHALGLLSLTPVNPMTNPPTPLGETYRAVVNEHHKGIVTDQVTLVSSFQMRIEIPPTGPFRGRLEVMLNVGPGGSSGYTIDVRCEP